MNLRAFAAILAMGILAVVAARPANEKKEAEAAIRQINQWTMEHFNAKEADQFAENYFAPDAMWLGHGRKAIDGRNAIRDHFKAVLANEPSLALSIEVTRIEQSSDLAYEVGREVVTSTNRDGAKRQSYGKYVAVWKRQPNGDWRCVVDAPSSENP